MDELTHTSSGTRRFPDGFLWGAAASAYQVEGAVSADGRGPSIWDVFAHTPGRTHRGDTGDIACDSYRRLDTDVALIAALGLGAYRFSISWSRIQADGRGPANPRGLDYYRRVAEKLREAGVRPVATVYHWDLPQALEDVGGWAVRDTAERLGELAGILGAELGDVIDMWITINEPQQVVHQGYRIGTHAPGRVDLEAAAASTHHILLGHARALAALRATLGADAEIGATLDPHPYIALDAAAEHAATVLDADFNRMYLDPILGRGYPADARAAMLPAAELIAPGDLEAIASPVDFLGINYYRPHDLRAGDWSDLRLGETRVPDMPGIVEYIAPETPCSALGWPIVPGALCDLLVRIDRMSGGLPIHVTENGIAVDDYVNPDGEVEDQERIDYIRTHLEAMLDALDAGVDLRGYFHWALLDNFEWAGGFRPRFGLHYVDYATGQRIPKRSAAFYGQVARSGALEAAVA